MRMRPPNSETTPDASVSVEVSVTLAGTINTPPYDFSPYMRRMYAFRRSSVDGSGPAAAFDSPGSPLPTGTLLRAAEADAPRRCADRATATAVEPAPATGDTPARAPPAPCARPRTTPKRYTPNDARPNATHSAIHGRNALMNTPTCGATCDQDSPALTRNPRPVSRSAAQRSPTAEMTHQRPVPSRHRPQSESRRPQRRTHRTRYQDSPADPFPNSPQEEHRDECDGQLHHRKRTADSTRNTPTHRNSTMTIVITWSA